MIEKAYTQRLQQAVKLMQRLVVWAFGRWVDMMEDKRVVEAERAEAERQEKAALAHQARPAQVLKSLQNVPERGVAQEGALRAGAIIALQGHLHTHGR